MRVAHFLLLCGVLFVVEVSGRRHGRKSQLRQGTSAFDRVSPFLGHHGMFANEGDHSVLLQKENARNWDEIVRLVRQDSEKGASAGQDGGVQDMFVRLEANREGEEEPTALRVRRLGKALMTGNQKESPFRPSDVYVFMVHMLDAVRRSCHSFGGRDCRLTVTTGTSGAHRLVLLPRNGPCFPLCAMRPADEVRLQRTCSTTRQRGALKSWAWRWTMAAKAAHSFHLRRPWA